MFLSLSLSKLFIYFDDNFEEKKKGNKKIRLEIFVAVVVVIR
jgi:hypothetical protein